MTGTDKLLAQLNPLVNPAHSDIFYAIDELGQREGQRTIQEIITLGSIFGNALFVDAAYGDDENAVKGSFMSSDANPLAHKFSSVTAAMEAASSGDVIIVYPGDYEEEGSLYKDGVTYYFYPGANVTITSSNPMFESPEQGQSCYVYGKGNFRNESVGGICWSRVEPNEDGTPSLHFEANNMSAVANPVLIEDGIMEVIANEISCDEVAAVYVSDSSFTGNRLLVQANIIRNLTFFGGTNSTINNVNSTGFAGNVKIVANQILGSPNGTANVIAFDNSGPVANFEIIASEIKALNSSGTNAVVVCFFHTNTTEIIKANIVSLGARPGIQCFGTNTGHVLKFDGDITCDTGAALAMTGSGDSVTINGVLVSASTSYTIVLGGSSDTLYLNGSVKNTSVTGLGISKTVSSPTAKLVVNTLKIITSGGNAITSVALDTIKVIHSLATNNACSPAIGSINSITGSMAYTDAGVQ